MGAYVAYSICRIGLAWFTCLRIYSHLPQLLRREAEDVFYGDQSVGGEVVDDGAAGGQGLLVWEVARGENQNAHCHA